MSVESAKKFLQVAGPKSTSENAPAGEQAFLDRMVVEGRAAGYVFTANDCAEALRQAVVARQPGELNDAELAGVAGGVVEFGDDTIDGNYWRRS